MSSCSGAIPIRVRASQSVSDFSVSCRPVSKTSGQVSFPFTGTLFKVTVTMDDDQALHGDGIGRARLASE
jgi:hypothetical protein